MLLQSPRFRKRKHWLMQKLLEKEVKRLRDKELKGLFSVGAERGVVDAGLEAAAEVATDAPSVRSRVLR